MLCRAATVHQKAVRCPERLSSGLTCSFMCHKVVIYSIKLLQVLGFISTKSIVLPISCAVLRNCETLQVSGASKLTPRRPVTTG